MVVLNQPGSEDSKRYDLSFMYTKRCNLACPFCMYSSGPDVRDVLDIGALKRWLATVDMDLIASFGVYGGEVSINLSEYGQILELLPADKPRFCISNGTWSMDPDKAIEFIIWCTRHKLSLVVSGTPEHRKHQNRVPLEALAREFPDAIQLKPPEEQFHPMGRLAGAFPVACTEKCMSWNRALRIAVQPDGSIIYQNCDGVYPVVGSIHEPFVVLHQRVSGFRVKGFGSCCSFYTGRLFDRQGTL